MDINIIVTGVLLVLSFIACLAAARVIEKAREHRAEAAGMLAEARAVNEDTKKHIRDAHAAEQRRSEAGVK